MKRDRLWQSLWGAAIALALSLGSLGCMVTGLDLVSYSQFGTVILWCVLSCVFWAGICNLRLAPIALAAYALALAVAWLRWGLEESAESLVYLVSKIYDSGYGWGTLSWTDKPGAAGLLGALCVLGATQGLTIAWTVVRRRSAWISLVFTLLPVATTLLLTDTVPDTFWLGLYLFGFLLLLLSQGVRRLDCSQGNSLCCRIALPVALVLGAVFLLNPQSGYNKQDLADKLEHAVTQLIQNLTAPEVVPPESSGSSLRLPVSGDTSTTVNLENVGPKSRQTQWVMTVQSSYTGTVYLRGASFALYDGQHWYTGSQEQTGREWPAQESTATESLTITTRNLHSVLYLPYYSLQFSNIQHGRRDNPDDLKSYRMSFYTPDIALSQGSAGSSVSTAYCELPQVTKAWATGKLLTILGTTSAPTTAAEVVRTAEKIGSYVRSSATYSLQTPRIHEGEADFVRWFMEESETGYCVHFASSAAVLLRAAGIPARYVTGYVVAARADKAVDVPLGNAHAWVEYYVPGVGWAVLEATPSTTELPELLPQGTTPPTASSGASQPGEATQPGQSTAPGETTPPTEATLPGQTPPATSQPDTSQTGTNGGVDGPQDSTVPREPLKLSWLKWVLWGAALLAAVPLQAILRRQLRRQRLFDRRINRVCLGYWQEATLFARILKEEPPTELLALARKAKFSQHTLTREEIAPFRGYIAQAEAQLRKHSWQRQLLYRVVYALY